MKSLFPCFGIVLLWSLSVFADDASRTSGGSAPSSISIAKLDPKMDRKEVTVTFAVAELGGVAQRDVPGKAPTFVIEAKSEQEGKDLTVWIEGELADVLDRLQLSFSGSNPIKKGTVIVATGLLEFSAGTGDRKGHESYTLTVAKWQGFRIVKPDHDR